MVTNLSNVSYFVLRTKTLEIFVWHIVNILWVEHRWCVVFVFALMLFVFQGCLSVTSRWQVFMVTFHQWNTRKCKKRKSDFILFFANWCWRGAALRCNSHKITDGIVYHSERRLPHCFWGWKEILGLLYIFLRGLFQLHAPLPPLIWIMWNILFILVIMSLSSHFPIHKIS